MVIKSLGFHELSCRQSQFTIFLCILLAPLELLVTQALPYIQGSIIAFQIFLLPTYYFFFKPLSLSPLSLCLRNDLKMRMFIIK